MVVAIAVALVGVGALLAARAVILREAATAYAATNPASATLDVDGGVDPNCCRGPARPGVADATTRQTIATRVRVVASWRRMLLFVVSPDDPLTIARFRVDSGVAARAGRRGPDRARRPQRAGRRRGRPARHRWAGRHHRTPTGHRRDVYDPALAPATQERTGYGYLTPAALARLGFQPVAEQLKIVVDTGPGTALVRQAPQWTARAASLATWLTAEGHLVHRIDAPPYRHPHQNQVNTITGLFLAFAAAALALAAVLVATTLGGMLAAQTSQIGVMKAVGATTGQLLRMYLTATLAIAATATALAVAPALFAGYGLVDLVGSLLNVDVTNRALPWWVFAGIGVAGIGLPLLVAMVPLVRATRITVRAALDDNGGASPVGTRRVDRWVTRLGGGRVGALAARNLLRRPARLALTLVLLCAGGALFTSGLNTALAWQTWVDEGLAKRSYDAQLEFAAPVSDSSVMAAVRGVAGVIAVETLVSLPATPADASGLQVQRTYPDGGHGRFLLTALPADTSMVAFDLIDGGGCGPATPPRWCSTRAPRPPWAIRRSACRFGWPSTGSSAPGASPASSPRSVDPPLPTRFPVPRWPAPEGSRPCASGRPATCRPLRTGSRPTRRRRRARRRHPADH